MNNGKNSFFETFLFYKTLLGGHAREHREKDKMAPLFHHDNLMLVSEIDVCQMVAIKSGIRKKFIL
jgi:hypothetical protein